LRFLQQQLKEGGAWFVNIHYLFFTFKNSILLSLITLHFFISIHFVSIKTTTTNELKGGKKSGKTTLPIWFQKYVYKNQRMKKTQVVHEQHFVERQNQRYKPQDWESQDYAQKPQ
jgi:hypothetical protein